MNIVLRIAIYVVALWSVLVFLCADPEMATLVLAAAISVTFPDFDPVAHVKRADFDADLWNQLLRNRF